MDRGGRIAGVTLLSGHTHDQWEASASADPEQAVRTVHEASAWIKERLASGSDKSKTITTLCLDTDGAVCSWVKPDDAEPALLRASVEQSREIDHDDFDAPEVSGASERFPDLPLEISYEPLRESPTSVGSRTAVIATPDIPVRLLLDQLDSSGIRVGAVTTIWHAIARVWDPGAHGSTGHDAQRIVASSSPVTACLIVDPHKGILIWSWSQSGVLISGGTVRLPRIGGAEHARAVLTEAAIARLGIDWLGWSSQLGVSPSRILLVTPRVAPDADDEDTGALDGAQIGSAVAHAWPGASIDLIEHNDPIAETLNKLARSEVDSALTTLASRPGRVHRSMYRWGAAALIAASAVVGIGAWHLMGRSSDARDQIASIEMQQTTLLNEVDPEIAISHFPLVELQGMIAALRGAGDPKVSVRAKPLLTELETISLVVGVPGITIQKIDIDSVSVNLMLRTDEIEVAEQLYKSLDQISGSRLDWRAPKYENKGDKILATFRARWYAEGSP